MWGAAALLEAAGVLSTFSWSLSCPAHCHPSIFPVFASGFLAGLVLGIASAFWICWAFLIIPPVAHPSTSPSQSRYNQLARLRAYVHEK